MRVLTLNLWNYTRPWDVRRSLIADLIRAHEPDVVALQESRHDFRFEHGKGQGEQLADLTGYHHTSAVGQVYLPLLRVDEGLSILTRESPQDTSVCRLTQLAHERRDENRRICLGVAVEVGGQRLRILDTHFSLSSTARLSNAVEVARFARAWGAEDLTVLMGDLNAEPDEESIRFLTGDIEIYGERADFTDCWLATHGADPGYTYASFHPVRRIDYVLARNLAPGTVTAAIVGGKARNSVYPSDHLGIVADLSLG